MEADVDISNPARLLADPARASMLLALTGVDSLTATELARRASVADSTASEHLSKLLRGGLVSVRRQGRHRYFALANPAVAAAVETLAAIAPPQTVRSLRDAVIGDAIRAARTCYDHLAGALGVALADSLVRERLIETGGGSRVTPRGAERFGSLGIDVEDLTRARRPLVRMGLDWSERREHLAGALGAALTARLFELRWLRRLPGSRAVRLTALGYEGLAEAFGMQARAG